MKVDRLNDNCVNALSNDIFGLRDLVLRIVLSGLDDDRITIGPGRFLKERHIGVQVPERRLLFEHEGDFVGLSRVQAPLAIAGAAASDIPAQNATDIGSNARA